MNYKKGKKRNRKEKEKEKGKEKRTHSLDKYKKMLANTLKTLIKKLFLKTFYRKIIK